LNPHLTLTVRWMDDATQKIKAIDRTWTKWGPSDPTSPHWYGLDHLERLVGACVADDRDNGRDRTVRELVSQFRGLSGTAKQRQVLEATGLAREKLSALVTGNTLHDGKVQSLLTAMQANSKRIKPADLGVIGRDNLMAKAASVGCEMKSFDYRKVAAETDDGLPFVLETAFGWLGEEAPPKRRMVLGVNWSPALGNPFRQLGTLGKSLDSVLEQQRVGRDEPVILLLHVACPRVEYTDRGKSAVVIHGGDNGSE
jgi:DNA topoisomerase VI subunit B